MRKITFLLFALLFSVFGYSQFPVAGTESFENTSGPDLPIPVASSAWTLGTGATGNQWAVFDNGVPAPIAGQIRWTSTTTSFNSGTQAAFLNRKQNGATGLISEDYLATPLVTVPANGQLTFYTKTGFNSLDDVEYTVKVNTNTTAGSQTTITNYTTTAQTWDKTTIVATNNSSTYELKTVDLSAFTAGTQVYIAFVRKFNQPTAARGGNSWYIDDVKLVQRCIDPTSLTASGFTTTTASLSWNPNGSTSWEIEAIPVTGTQTFSGQIYSGTLPYTATGLTPGTNYVYFVRARCTDSNSNWVGPFSFSTTTPGINCASPITVSTLPYSTTDTTANYGDTYDVAQPTACTGSATNYMQGNDVFYSYTATTTGAISVTMTPTGTNSSVFVYQGCANVGVSCLAGVANTAGTVRTITSINVTAGQTYIIVLSSSATTQTYPYSLLIQQLNCAQPTAGAAVPTPNGATLSWTSPTSTSWEYVVQTAGSAVPSGSGTTTTSSTSTLASGLNADTAYQYWVRADCGNGTFSAWAGPYLFTTLVPIPACGGLFMDAGGQAGNYASNSNITYPICPTAGNQVTVTFTAFNTQLNTDLLKVYDGNGITGTLLATYSGTTIPAPITSSSPDGCLTFVFTSNATTQAAGWLANVTCAPAPVCQKPIVLTTPAVAYNAVTVGWTQPQNPDTTVANAWEVVAVACGSPAPTATTTPVLTATMNPFQVTGLSPLTCYDFYVRAVCSTTSSSSWSGPVTVTTPLAPPICGGNFVDPGGIAGNYPNNINAATGTTTIIPAAGNQVTVTFTSFNTQLNTDILNVYDGPNATGTLLASYSGTTLPPPITSSFPDGSLTFVFTSNGSNVAAGWVATVTCAPAPPCQKPIVLTTPVIAYNAVTVGWTQPQNPDTTTPNAWEVVAVTCGSPAPTATTTPVLTATTNPFQVTGLLPLTCYNFYVRAVCSSTSSSSWSGPIAATTPIAPAICGGNFVDPGGIAANYANNITAATGTTTINPVNPGDQVTVTFTAFNTQLNTDILNVYDGTSSAGILLASYSGTTIPPAITSSSPSGSLTFVFTSNGTTNAAGWLANVTCAPAPACQKPVVLTTSAITYNSVTVGWTQTQNPDTTTPNAWQVVAVACGSPAPTATTTPVLTATTNPFQVTGLSSLTCYDFYVRAVCSSTSSSSWTGPVSATTPIAPPICGGNFVNVQQTATTYPNNSDSTVTICPSVTGQLVTVTFTSFATETNWDGLYVFDGNSNTAPQISSANGAGTVPGGVPGSYWGTLTGANLPGPFTATSASGCLTFRFRSDGSGNTGGWVANITCAPAPTCPKPTSVIASSASATTASVSWVENGTATQWEIIHLPAGSPAPGAGASGTLVTTNPATITGLTVGTFYDVYVRAVCSTSDSSIWSNLSTLYINPPLPNCAGVDTSLTPNLSGVINLCPDNTCVNLNASYTETHTTSAYTVASTSYSPPFPFTGGTRVSVDTDDVWSGNIAIPFKFCFYGVTYNALNIGSNGVVTFDTHTANSNCPWAYTATIPNTAFPILNAIYAPYQDVNPNVLDAPAQPNINYQILGVAPCRVMVINFSKLGQFSCGVTVGLQTSQVVLYETSNAIDIYVKDRTVCPGWNSGNGVIGIQNGAGTNAVVPPGRNTGTWTATNEAWRFLPNGPSNVTFSWLQDGQPYSTNTSTSICPTHSTTMTAQAIYTACDGTQVIKSENLQLNIVSPITPAFTQIAPICQNSTAPVLPTSSNDTVPVTGTWLPATINTSAAGTSTYTFTPTVGQCANSTTMNITINPGIIPTFLTPAPICSGDTAPVLPTSSSNAIPITGTWSPSTVSNTTSGTYTFTPTTGQCAVSTTLNVTVNTNCSFGSYASAVWLSNCAVSNFFNTVGTGVDIIGPAANIFPNANLGTYVQNSNALILKGGEVKTFKSATANVCSARLNYRIYPQANTPGAFQVMDLPFFDNCSGGTFGSGGPCQPGDQKWQKVLPNTLYPTELPIDLTAYSPGNYTIQVYYDISGSSSTTTACDENIIIDNNGAYYTASFTIQAQPSYLSSNPTTCSGTNGTITISSLAPNATYSLTYTGSTVVGPINVTSDATGNVVINGLSSGTYSNFVLGINSCSLPYSTPIVLVDPSLPTVSVNSPVVCSGSPATVTATPGTPGTYTYAWTIPSGTNPGSVDHFDTTIAGAYSVIITNTVTGCSSTSASGTVTFSTLITPTFTTIAPICSGATAPSLPTSSNNTTPIVGVWSPSVISTATAGITQYTFTPNAGQCSGPISINVTVNSVPTPTVSVIQPTCTTSTGTIEVTSPITSLGTLWPTDLFISEVTDSNSGSLSYVELYNGTGSSINLSNYAIKTANNGNAYSFTLPLNNVNIASGSTYVVALGNDSSCSSIPGGNGSLGVQSNASGSVNFSVNGNDHYGLFNGSNLIDSWGVFGSSNWAPASIGTEGADFRRKNTISPLPNTTFNNNDWIILDYAGSSICANNDYSNIGLYNFTTATTNYQYSVDGGPYQSNPIFTGLNPGLHNITVLDTITGCISVIVPVTLDTPILNPTVTVNSPTVCAGINAVVTATPSVAGTYTYTWTYPGAASNPGNVASFIATVSGVYTVTISVSGCTSNAVTSTVTINALPTVTVNSPSACQGSNAAVVASPTPSTGTYTYVWSVPGSVTDPGNVATFNATVSGTYSVVITDTTTGCSSASASGIVTINALPTVTVNSPTVCAGTNAVVTAVPSPTGVYTYVWTVPATASNPGNVDHFTATVSGTYTVTITNTNGCTSTAATSTVTINALPTVTVNSPSACQGSNTAVVASPTPSTGTYTYVWTVPVSATNPGNVATFNATVSGSYCVVITDTTTGCSSTSVCGTVTINPIPTVTVTSPTVCAGTNAVVTATPGVAGTYTYTWTYPAAASNPGNVDHFTATVPGTYTVTITNAGGCTSTAATSTVTINAIPVVNVSNDTVCQGATATITATPTTSGTYTYAWTGPIGSTPGTSATVTTTIAGTYSVVITNTATGCVSLSASGTVAFIPAFDFTLNGECIDNKFTLEVIPSGNSFDLNSANYNWTLNPSSTTIGSNPTFDATTYIGGLTTPSPLPVTFSVSVNVNGCVQSHSIIVDRIYCDIQKGISPNTDGKNDFFDLRLMNVQKLEIFNRYGTKVYSKFEYTNEWVGQTDAGNELPDGTYYYVIEFKNNQASKTGWIYINREN